MQKIQANGKLYEIKIAIAKSPFFDEAFMMLKKELGYYDALIKNETHYFLCNEISEAEFTEEIKK